MFGAWVKILKFAGMFFIYLKVTSKLGCARSIYYTLLRSGCNAEQINSDCINIHALLKRVKLTRPIAPWMHDD